MSEIGDRVSKELDTLKTLRDELRVQMHLAKSEARESFEGAEKKWQELEGRIKRLRDESADSLHDVGEAGRLLLQEIGEAYKHIKESL